MHSTYKYVGKKFDHEQAGDNFSIVHRADLTRDVMRKVAPFVLSKL